MRRYLPHVVAASLSALIAACLSPVSIHSPDEETMFREAEAFARGAAHIAPVGIVANGLHFGAPPGKDGRTFSLFAPGVPLLASAAMRLPAPAAPLRSSWAPGRVEGAMLAVAVHAPRFRDPAQQRRAAAALWVGVPSVFVAVLLVGLLAGPGPWGAAVGLLAGIASPLAVYGGTLFSEAPQTALLAVSVWAWARRRPWACGAAWGALCGVHVLGVLAFPLLAGWRRRDAGRVLVALLPFLASLAAWNAYRFGVPWETGRGVGPAAARAALGYGWFVAPWEGLYGLLMAVPKGALWFAPLALLGLALCPRSRVGRLACALFVVRLLLVASRLDWHGGACMGPRYLIPVLVLGSLGLREVPSRYRGRLFGLGLLLGLCLAQSALVAPTLMGQFAQLGWIRDGMPGGPNGLHLLSSYAPRVLGSSPYGHQPQPTAWIYWMGPAARAACSVAMVAAAGWLVWAVSLESATPPAPHARPACSRL